MKTKVFMVMSLLIILAVAGIVFLFTYNGIISNKKAVEEAKAQIDVVLQRRLDLIPNLVETVKGLAQYEKETLVAITDARARALEALKAASSEKTFSRKGMESVDKSQSELSGTLKTLFALTENYPDLKAAVGFLSLQDQLEGSENRISVARIRYNTAVRVYNTSISMFPGNILAPYFGFKELISFEAKPEAQEPVKVKF
jgi:LemA protein